MTVYKGYMRIAKKYKGMFLLYVVIFFGITLLYQYLSKEQNFGTFQAEGLKIAVVDEDGGEMAQALQNYLGQFHQVNRESGEISVLQEKLFYRDVEYIVRIPDDFYEKCIEEGQKLQITQVPGSYSAFYVDTQIERFLSNAKIYAAAGFTMEETAAAVEKRIPVETEFLDTGKNGGGVPAYNRYFQYVPYLYMGVLGYVVGSMISAMRRGSLKERMQASAVPQRQQSLEGLLACGTVALLLWGVTQGAAGVIYGKELLESSGLGYYLLNSLAMLCVSVALAYLIGSLSKRIDTLNGMVNTASLGMCFLGGVFVPLELMGTGVKKASRFLPVYWFETANNLLGEFALEAVREEVLQAVGIQFAFALVFVCVTLAIGKARRSK